MTAFPKHIAIIMDGNGRWAQSRGCGRTWGHREGAKRVDEIVTECCELGVSYLTLYAFSAENWKRPPHEVSVLMRLLFQHLKTMDKKLLRNRVQLVVQGDIQRLPKFAQTELARVMKLTSFRDRRMVLNLCLSYGGRQEITHSVKEICRKVEKGELKAEDITEETVQQNLYQPTIPDPELLIRTGGEHRVSNFLLWEIAYSEFWVTPTLWPDFYPKDLHQAISEFQKRNRRFGLTSEQAAEAHL